MQLSGPCPASRSPLAAASPGPRSRAAPKSPADKQAEANKNVLKSAEFMDALRRARGGDTHALSALTVDLADRIRQLHDENVAMRSTETGSGGAQTERGRRGASDPANSTLQNALRHQHKSGAASPAAADAPQPISDELRDAIGRLRDEIVTLEDQLSSSKPGTSTAYQVQSMIADRQRRVKALLLGDLEAASAPTQSDMPQLPAHLSSPHTPGAAGQARSEVDSIISSKPVLQPEQLMEIFEFYANFGRTSVMTYQDTLDSFMFMKMCRECPGLMHRSKLTRTDVDLIFTKARPKMERRITFSHFMDALVAIAEKRYPDHRTQHGLRLLLANHFAPLYDIVQVEMEKTGDTEVPLDGIFKRLYDVRKYVLVASRLPMLVYSWTVLAVVVTTLAAAVTIASLFVCCAAHTRFILV